MGESGFASTPTCWTTIGPAAEVPGRAAGISLAWCRGGNILGARPFRPGIEPVHRDTWACWHGHQLACHAGRLEKRAWIRGSCRPCASSRRPNVHPPPGHPAPGKGPGGHLRRRHRQPLFFTTPPPRSGPMKWGTGSAQGTKGGRGYDSDRFKIRTPNTSRK